MTDAVGAANIEVEVVYAEAQWAVVKRYRLEAGATVARVLELASVDAAFAAIDVLHAPAGIFGRRAAPTQQLADGDRVELYRALPNDPKQARRARARAAGRQ